ncbi:MAG: hypothetical protein JWN65_637 [Solirubrobacterales bacterium]|nr:hypothetical protein [Solirubrobacterales bacterium]
MRGAGHSRSLSCTGRGSPAFRSTSDGFIPVDKIQRARGLGTIFAAGDITAGSIKQGGLAAHQAERAALAIARMAGLSPPQKFDPATLRGAT